MHEIPVKAWPYCDADVYCGRYDTMVLDYWSKVALPALQHAQAEVEHWASSEQDTAPFVHMDRVGQYLVTAHAMCLSVQSVWERQLRAYLVRCAGWSNTALIKKIENEPWGDLQKHFANLRGVSMQAFMSYPDLNMLAMLGNVCRHGPGRGLNDLWKAHPELWPDLRWPPEPGTPPSIDELHISIELLERMVGAVAGFWQFLGYMYEESLRSKAPSLVARLPAQRERHAAAIAHFNSVVGP